MQTQTTLIMQAFIPAAGLGSRLKPLTDHRPKALVEVSGVPLIKIAIDNLSNLGVRKIVVNVHHFADLLTQYLHENHWDAEVLISDERSQLLDTGGGLKKAAQFFNPDEPIIIHNVDVLTHFNLQELINQHSSSMNIATLAVSQRNTSRYLLFDKQQHLVGWHNVKTDEFLWVEQPINDHINLAFSGIAILEPHLLDLLPPPDHPFSIIPAYLQIAKNHRINYFLHNTDDWLDVGKPETLQLAQTWY